MNIPNTLTLARIVMIPVLVAVYYLPFKYAGICAATIFGIAALTDWADGYLARKLDQGTPLGAFLDPVADKLIVAFALVVLVEHYASLAFTVPAMIIIGREIVISALREWMAELGERASVAVSFIGKVKTTAQMVAIIMLLGDKVNVFGDWWHNLGFVVLYIAAALTLWSMLVYLKAAWPALMSKS